MSRPFNDLTGRVFGLWTVLGLTSNTGVGRGRYWKCQCACGVVMSIRGRNLVEGGSSSCGCDHETGYGNLSGSFWATVVSNSRARNIALEIGIAEASDLLDTQGHVCALSGLPIVAAKKWKDRKTQTASLDRIDSSLGYVIGNVQWVHKDVNWMKGSFDQQHFINMCRLIGEHNDD